MFLFPSQTAAAVTPQVSAGRRAELCLFCTENTQHGPSSQWRVSHYLSTTRTHAAVACVSLSFYNTDPGCSGREAGAPLRPRTRPGNMRTFVVIVTCQHPPDWASNYRKIRILYTPGFAELFRQIYLHLSMRKFNPMTNTFVCSLLLCLRIEHKKCKNASDDPETAKILFRQVTGYVWYG